ncbi:MAG: hypothetical protein ABSH38_20985 [Verrucomicrobiota bacterium]
MPGNASESWTGSCDPVHLGHMLVAQAAIEEPGLNRLFLKIRSYVSAIRH